MPSEIRLHVKQLLAKEQCVPLTKEQCHYLFGVMRLGLGDKVLLFNGRDGEWRSDIVRTGKRSGLLRLQEQMAPLVMPPDVWLLFAPIKKARTDFIVEKAAEMGAAQIVPAQYVADDLADRARVAEESIPVLVKKLEVSL